MCEIKAIKISGNVYWVGANDFDCRSFHGYSTPNGVTYNAYLITGKEPVVIDSVKAAFTDEMITRINSVIPVNTVKHIISNHSEFDHSGAIKQLYELSGAKVYASAAGVKALNAMYGDLNYTTLNSGETIDLAGIKLTAHATPMVHWPDNIVTVYEGEKRILFSNDALGQHYASSKKLDVEVDLNTVMDEAKKYYANIVMPYSAQAAKAAAAVKSINADIIAPSHGIIWTKHICDILSLYDSLTKNEKTDKAIIVYDSMWGNTAKLSRTVGAIFENKELTVKYCDLRCTDLSDIITELTDAKYLALGCPTFYGTITPHTAAFLSYLKALKPQNIEFMCFGSYGWGGGAIKEMTAALSSMGFNHIADTDDITVIY